LQAVFIYGEGLTMKGPHLLLCAFLTAHLLGCTSKDVTAIKNNRIEQAVCCANYSQFSWVPLAGDSLKVIIDADSPIARFDEEKSYFSAFVVPENIDKLHVSLSSLMSTEGVFAPHVLLLDAKFNQVETYPLTAFSPKNASLFHFARYQTDFMMEREKTPYLVVYSPEKYRKAAVTVPHPEKIWAKTLGMKSPNLDDLVIMHRNVGALELDLKPLRFRAYKATEANKPFSVFGELKKPAPVIEKIAHERMMKVSEAFYNQQITQSIQEGDIGLALDWLDEAKRAGSLTAKETFIKIVKP
jgi:maltose operon protein